MQLLRLGYSKTFGCITTEKEEKPIKNREIKDKPPADLFPSPQVTTLKTALMEFHFFEQLNVDMTNQVASILTLKEVSRFARTSKKNSENDQIWRLAANNLGITLNPKSSKAAKIQLNELFIKKVAFSTVNRIIAVGNIDLINKEISVSRCFSNIVYDDYEKFFNEHSLPGYFFKDCLGFNDLRIIYRDANGNTRQISSLSTSKKQWGPGEEKEWKRVHSEMKEVKIQIV